MRTLNWLVAASKLHNDWARVALLSGPTVHFLYYGRGKNGLNIHLRPRHLHAVLGVASSLLNLSVNKREGCPAVGSPPHPWHIPDSCIRRQVCFLNKLLAHRTIRLAQNFLFTNTTAVSSKTTPTRIV